MGNLPVTFAAMKQSDPGFWDMMGPFFASRAIRKELGAAMSSDENYTWFVARRGEDVAGFLALDASGGRATLRHVYTVPGHRGHGIVRELLDLCEAHAFGDASLEYLTVVTNNAEMFEKRGYMHTGRRGRYAVMRREK